MGYFRTLAKALTGRPMASTSGYNAATSGRRMLNIVGTTRGINSLALSDGPRLTALARKAVMDNPLAANGVSSYIAEVIGTGIRPHSNHEDPDTRKLLEREFSRWVPQASAARRIGPGGKPDSINDFYTLESLVCRNVVEAGEAFARLRPRMPEDGLRVPLQLDLIEPEQLPFWKQDGGSGTNLVRGGIEFDQIGQRVAYHFYRNHPGDATVWPNAYEIVRVPAESVLHVMEPLRGNQIRAITSLAPILVLLSDLNEYDDAERFKKKLGAYLFAWRKSQNADDTGVASSSSVGTDVAPSGSAYVESRMGTITLLDTNAGEEFGFYNTPDVGTMYESFMRVQREPIATVIRISYEMLTGNMTGVNYSSARVRLIALRRVWQQFQMSVIVHQFCRPVWRAWLDAAALAGVIDAVDYRKSPEQYLSVEWLAQPWDWVDPVKDVESKRMEVESAFDSREAVVASRGRDVEEVDAAIARDHARESTLGIVPVYGSSRAAEPAPAGGDAGVDAGGDAGKGQ